MSETHGKVIAKDGHEYHKSKTANATVAPTNEATIEKAQGNHLKPEVLQLVTIIDYEWNLKGELDLNAIAEEYGYKEAELVEHLKDVDCVTALVERGISPLLIAGLINVQPLTKTAKLTPIQLVVANRIMDLNDTRSDRKKMQDLGVTSAQYAAWQRDPEFRSYLQSRAESLVGDAQHEAMLALVDRVKSRDLSAIKYYHELTGRFVQASTSQAGNNSADLQTIIMRVIEIIIDEVDDPDTASRISDRLTGLVTGAQVAGIIAAPSPVETPSIAEAREITPEVLALMQQGVGYDG